jgi:hypothetical protein
MQAGRLAEGPAARSAWSGNDDMNMTRNKAGRVERRITEARDSLPGERNDLPEGTLPGMPVEPQGDENREPPPNAPTIPP